jgi:hypothetical protein
MDCAGRVQSYGRPDLSNGRRVAAVAHGYLDVLENGPLTIGNGVVSHDPSY